MRILALSGSIRSKSTNRSILLAAKSLAPQGVEIVLFDEIDKLPHFNPDLDHENPPIMVGAFRRALRDSKALIISTPEYAHGIPGVLKNALDWLVSSPEMIEVLQTTSAKVNPEAVLNIQGVRSKFNEVGHLIDPEVSKQIASVIEALR
jgi:chromate reductase